MDAGKSLRVVTVAAMVTLSGECAAAVPLFGQQTSAATTGKAAISVHRGIITWIDGDTLVLSYKTSGKSEQVRLVMKPETVRSGIVAMGSRVTARYRTEGNQHIVTSIQVLSEKGR
jgi:endonuclease YncB( thermonuclease family)